MSQGQQENSHYSENQEYNHMGTMKINIQISELPFYPSSCVRSPIKNRSNTNLEHPSTRIPEQFQQYYLDYQNKHQRQFMKCVNLIGQLTFLSYFFCRLGFITGHWHAVRYCTAQSCHLGTVGQLAGFPLLQEY